MKILVAVDGSKYGRWAIEWIARLPFKRAPEVMALHALDIAAVKAPFMVQPAVAGNARAIQNEIDRLVKFAKTVTARSTSLLAKLRLKGTAIYLKGDASATILQQAPGPTGLISLGSRGLSSVERFMLGSVSTRVSTHAACSTLVVKEHPRPVRRLLVATDGSKPAGKVVRFITRELKPGTGGQVVEIVVLHVTLIGPLFEIKRIGHAIVRDAAQTLSKAGFRVSQSVREGDPADQIMKVADEQDVDLILTGAKGRGAIARFLLGSVSTKLIQHSTCSVLIVR